MGQGTGYGALQEQSVARFLPAAAMEMPALSDPVQLPKAPQMAPCVHLAFAMPRPRGLKGSFSPSSWPFASAQPSLAFRASKACRARRGFE